MYIIQGAFTAVVCKPDNRSPLLCQRTQHDVDTGTDSLSENSTMLCLMPCDQDIDTVENTLWTTVYYAFGV